jgi:hypothetical protein
MEVIPVNSYIERMKKLLTTVVLLALPLAAQAQQASPVTSTVTVTMTATHAGTLSITLTPATGVHVNSTPAPEFLPDSGSSILLKGSLKVPVATDGKLPAGSTLIQNFRVAPSLRSDTLTIGGTLSCFCCSDTEGWCVKSRQHVTATILVKR